MKKARTTTINETQIATQRNLNSGHRSLRRTYQAKRGLAKIEALLRERGKR